MKFISAATICGLAILHVAPPSSAAPILRRSLEANEQQQIAQSEKRFLAADGTDAMANSDWTSLLADRETRALAYMLEAADLIDEDYDEDDEELLASGGRRRALANGGRRRALASGGRRRALANGGRRRR